MGGVTTLLAFLASLLAGAVVPLQAGANAALGRSLGHPLWATLVSLAVSALAGLAVLAILRVPGADVAMAAKGPAWSWLGGVFGVVYITTALILAPRLGAGAFMGAVVAGQMVAALAMDRFGLLGFAVKELTPGRLLGAGLVVAGVLVMQMSSSAIVAAKAV